MSLTVSPAVQYVIDRLKEPSTWSGLAAVLMVVGINMSPEVQQALTATFVAFASLVGSVFAAINIIWKKDTQSKGTGDGSA